MTSRHIKIKKGWVIETKKDKDSCLIVAKKKLFEPNQSGFCSGEIIYTIYQSNKKVNHIDLEKESEEISKDLYDWEDS